MERRLSVAYKTLTFDQKIEQLETTGNGYKEMAERETSLHMRNHAAHWAGFMLDLAEDIKTLKALQKKEVTNG